MARPLRIEYKGAWYHVLNRGRRREKIFFENADYSFFLKLLGHCRKLFGVLVHCYSLIPNHYHLIIHTPNANLSRMMRHLNGVYTQYINRKYELEGSLFKGRFKSILIESDSYLLELVRYIHRNPYKAKLEKKIGQHKWTSHRAYMNRKERPEWLVVEDVLERFSRYEKTAMKELDLYVKKQPPAELEKRLDGANWPAVLGGDSFKEKIKQFVLGKEIDFSEVPAGRDYRERISAVELLKRVKEAYALDAEAVCAKRNRQYTELKRGYIYVCYVDLQLGGREIAEALGGVTRAMISRQVRQAEIDLQEKKGCCKAVKRILELAQKVS